MLLAVICGLGRTNFLSVQPILIPYYLLLQITCSTKRVTKCASNGSISWSEHFSYSFVSLVPFWLNLQFKSCLVVHYNSFLSVIFFNLCWHQQKLSFKEKKYMDLRLALLPTESVSSIYTQHAEFLFLFYLCCFHQKWHFQHFGRW